MSRSIFRHKVRLLHNHVLCCIYSINNTVGQSIASLYDLGSIYTSAIDLPTYCTIYYICNILYSTVGRSQAPAHADMYLLYTA